MIKQTFIAAAALAALSGAAPAAAQSYVTLGRLTCGSEGGTGLIITSTKNLMCTYTPANGAPTAVYAGMIRKFGLDVGTTGKSVMVWDVLAKTGTPITAHALAGEYYGLGADASFAVGGGAKVIAGGTNKAFMLQPVNVQVQEGLNIAVGVDQLILAPAG
ncbi:MULTISPECIES: DUF992 domain-containing protein [unclassified Sinorhizobium]|uniref:DUF992 domain-containing protein n=1 Tax=unclassified Sinorhizobium TaxID=2613772 RepID=UPI0024C24C30|nr:MULTISPECIES: DUF992 domain-containing protein [unclassified Sinorhizobium]MDK1375339.1 DUF992 domain-containing protein [Sinorhizobium sp. 6-70]MDK1477992.1 DUF992 domain-containing protein [Sinorhizobium sp. 6-117]